MEFKGTPFTWGLKTVDNNIHVQAGGDTEICIVASRDLKEEEFANAKLISEAPETTKKLLKLVNLLESNFSSQLMLSKTLSDLVMESKIQLKKSLD